MGLFLFFSSTLLFTISFAASCFRWFLFCITFTSLINYESIYHHTNPYFAYSTSSRTSPSCLLPSSSHLPQLNSLQMMMSFCEAPASYTYMQTTTMVYQEASTPIPLLLQVMTPCMDTLTPRDRTWLLKVREIELHAEYMVEDTRSPTLNELKHKLRHT